MYYLLPIVAPYVVRIVRFIVNACLHLAASELRIKLCYHRSMLMALPYVLQFFAGCLAILSFAKLAAAHQESGEWDCDADEEARLVAQFRPGIVTLDGHAEDWADVDGFEFPLRPALDPDEDKEYKSGKMSVKVL